MLASVPSLVDSVVPFGAAHALLWAGLVYTAPSSPVRWVLQAAIVACCVTAVRSPLFLAIPGQAGGQYIFGFMMSGSHFMLLARAAAATHAPPGRAWRWAWDMLRSARWGVSPKMLPPFRRSDRSYVPGRREFLRARAWDVVWTAGLDWVLIRHQPYIGLWDFTLVPDGFLHRLADVEAREWVIRIYIMLMGKAQCYLALRAAHSLFSVVGVACGDDPAGWPPLFGSVAEAYRVRTFYVSFWHHLVRKIFTTHASFVVNDVCRVPRQTEVSRYLILAGSFLVSAAMHVFVAPNVPLECEAWAQLRYYSSIAGAIVLEDLAIAAYRRLAHRPPAQSAANRRPIEAGATAAGGVSKTTAHHAKGGPRKRAGAQREAEADRSVPGGQAAERTAGESSAAWRILGYLWVFAFEVWSCSKLVYVTKQCRARLDPSTFEGVVLD